MRLGKAALCAPDAVIAVGSANNVMQNARTCPCKGKIYSSQSRRMLVQLSASIVSHKSDFPRVVGRNRDNIARVRLRMRKKRK